MFTPTRSLSDVGRLRFVVWNEVVEVVGEGGGGGMRGEGGGELRESARDGMIGDLEEEAKVRREEEEAEEEGRAEEDMISRGSSREQRRRRAKT